MWFSIDTHLFKVFVCLFFSSLPRRFWDFEVTLNVELILNSLINVKSTSKHKFNVDSTMCACWVKTVQVPPVVCNKHLIKSCNEGVSIYTLARAHARNLQYFHIFIMSLMTLTFTPYTNYTNRSFMSFLIVYHMRKCCLYLSPAYVHACTFQCIMSRERIYFLHVVQYPITCKLTLFNRNTEVLVHCCLFDLYFVLVTLSYFIIIIHSVLQLKLLLLNCHASNTSFILPLFCNIYL
jgi:hypothetical protein